jgi:hypothetical protein
MSGHEVATGNVNNGRYKIAVQEVAGRNYSGQTFQITVRFQDRIYERSQRVKWQAGGVTTLDLEFGTGSGWRWHQVPSQNDQRQMPSQNDQRRMEEDQRRMEQNDEDRDRRMAMDEQRMQRENEESKERMDMERQRMDMEQQRMESEEKLRREQMEMESDRQVRDEESRREMEGEDRARRMEMEQQRMEQENAMREKEGEDRRKMELQRMKMEDEDRARRMEMEQQRMGSGQPGVQPVAGERPKSGPGRGLFSNSKAGEATAGIDNIMDPGMLTIIGIALTVLTTGMTLFKGD